jgi:hypothetical protein
VAEEQQEKINAINIESLIPHVASLNCNIIKVSEDPSIPSETSKTVQGSSRICTEPSRPTSPTNRPSGTKTWKKRARANFQKGEEGEIFFPLAGKRSATSLVNQGQPSVASRKARRKMKRRWRSEVFRRRLRFSPAIPHEHSKLELPGAWEPPDSSRSSPIGEGKETQFGFPYGNQNESTPV